MVKNLLLIGRFQPFHLGHLAIVKRYAKQGYFVKIGIGSSQKDMRKHDPFTLAEREEMITLALLDEGISAFAIYALPDIPDDQEWLSNVFKTVGDIDVVFSGNKWTIKCFRHTSVRLHVYDERTQRIKGISASGLRKEWLAVKTRRGLPMAVYRYVRGIGTFERVKDLNDPKKKVHYVLLERRKSVATVESCTGGALSRSLVGFSGASLFFKAGIVAYSNEAKEQLVGVDAELLKKESAVSAAVAEAMAVQMRSKMGTDYAVSTTGYADPGSKQAGLVFVAVASATGVRIKELHIRRKARGGIIESATRQALLLLYEVLREEAVRG